MGVQPTPYRRMHVKKTGLGLPPIVKKSVALHAINKKN